MLTAHNELNQKSPSIPRGAFLAARKGIGAILLTLQKIAFQYSYLEERVP
jgi:hypothetical protein